MAHPLYILKIMLTARRPSHTTVMRAVSMPFWLHEGYNALTFFGAIITSSEKEAERYNALHSPLTQSSPQWGGPEGGSHSPLKSWYHPVKYHETIHLRQAQSVHNSWLCFYWKYFIFWIHARRANRILPNAGYELNPFEMEAYANMYNPHYLDQYPDGAATGWKQYAKMNLAQRFWARRRYAKD